MAAVPACFRTSSLQSWGPSLSRAHTSAPPNLFPLGPFSKKNKSFFSSMSTTWSWPRHVPPDPALEKAAGEREQAGHLGGLLDEERLPACPHLPHQAGEEAVDDHDDHTPRGGRPEPELPERTRGTAEERRRLWSRLCLSCDHCGHTSPQRIVPAQKIKKKKGPRLILQLTNL